MPPTDNKVVFLFSGIRLQIFWLCFTSISKCLQVLENFKSQHESTNALNKHHSGSFVSNFPAVQLCWQLCSPLGGGGAGSLEPWVLWSKSDRPGRHALGYLFNFVYPSHSGNNIQAVNKFGASGTYTYSKRSTQHVSQPGYRETSFQRPFT